MSARPLPPPVNPALLQHAKQRRQSLENRLADQITRFAGSMRFVYIHVVWFATWIGLQVEHYPFGLLTMIVSLEAIILSTFVMISQNRADEKRGCPARFRVIASACLCARGPQVPTRIACPVPARACRRR